MLTCLLQILCFMILGQTAAFQLVLHCHIKWAGNDQTNQIQPTTELQMKFAEQADLVLHTWPT